MGNFILSLEAQDKTVSLSIKNEMGQDCYISENFIMLDGFMSDKFTITHQSGEQIIYQGITVKYYPKLTLIRKDESLSNKLDLSDAYDFTLFGEYSIDYFTSVNCCEDIEGKDCSASESIGASAAMTIRDDCINILNTDISSPEQIAILITSKLFKSLNLAQQTCLIGDILFPKLQNCLSLTEEPYNLECIGNVISDQYNKLEV